MWFRRDLRFYDNAALYHALKNCRTVWCAFVFDRDILDRVLERGLTADRRVEFIRESLRELDEELRAHGGGLIVRHDYAEAIIPRLAEDLSVDVVFTNGDYEPHAVRRDLAVAETLKSDGRGFFSFKDQVIFEKSEVLAGSGTFYSVFTPYKRAWLGALSPFYVRPYPVEGYAENLAPIPASLGTAVPTLEAMGFAKTNLAELKIPTGMSGASSLFDDFLQRIDSYRQTRDFPALKGPSYLSVHLRFGTISVRALARAALELTTTRSSEGAETWLSELIWRDFHFQILHHNPQVGEPGLHRAFKAEYDAIRWETGPAADELFPARVRPFQNLPYAHRTRDRSSSSAHLPTASRERALPQGTLRLHRKSIRR